MSEATESEAFNSNKRRNLFLDLAARPGGVTPGEVYKIASARGDTVTEEAYYNIARRLAHRGILRIDGMGAASRYFGKAGDAGHWMDEDDLWGLVDPDYPLPALTVANESAREMRNVSEQIWIDLRNRLRRQSARDLFKRAIESYVQDYCDQINMLVEIADASTPGERAKLRQEAETSQLLLLRLVRYGLGISTNAVQLPLNVESAVAARQKGEVFAAMNRDLLAEELARRVSDEPFIVDAEPIPTERKWLIGAVDGSTRGGVLSFLGEEGDFVSGHAPLISINTAVGQVDRDQRIGSRYVPTFVRLPEKPEDMQREDNRFTVMAKMLFPDMSDGEYMHAVWNAMDLIEGRAALRLLANWTTPTTHLEIPAADVVLKDGAVSPQDRDFSHYADYGTYGRIVREAIKVNWEIAKHSRDDGQTIAGVVKTAQLSVFAPVVNWFACRLMAEDKSNLSVWPMNTMNILPDQVVLTQLLTAGCRKGDAWLRTCIVVRPFVALTSFARNHRRAAKPSDIVMKRHEEEMRLAAAGTLDSEKVYFWKELFRSEHDPYVKMLDHVSYASFFLGAVPRLDLEKQLPRIEFIVNGSNIESETMAWDQVGAHRDRLISALAQNGFDVSAEHNMFGSDAKLDILPSILIRVHDTVKHWAADLLSRVQEYVGHYISKYVQFKKVRGIKIRPFSRGEYEVWYNTLKSERDAAAGSPTKRKDEDLPRMPTDGGHPPRSTSELIASSRRRDRST